MSTPQAQSAPSLDFVLLYVSNIDEAYTYFTEKLGFQPLPEESGPTFRQLRGGDGPDFALEQATPESARAGTIELYFKTPDLEGTHNTYSQRGVQATPIQHMPFGSIFQVDAPDNHQVIMMGAN